MSNWGIRSGWKGWVLVSDDGSETGWYGTDGYLRYITHPDGSWHMADFTENLIKRAADQVVGVFNNLPRPKELADFDVWEIIGPRMNPTHSDSYFAWVCAKLLPEKPGTPAAARSNRRFAVGIKWTGDELEQDFESAIGMKVTRAVLGFCDMAEEYEEGGLLPDPLVGRNILDRKRDIRISGVWLRYDGLLVEMGGTWYHVVKEHTQDALSHIANPSGILKSPVDRVTQYSA